ncbi:MAG TPA: hypothetical protein VFM18_02425, partial [Methanosarcina sp.]|nr:hypothetical protein [Methanosarcina sp.]
CCPYFARRPCGRPWRRLCRMAELTAHSAAGSSGLPLATPSCHSHWQHPWHYVSLALIISPHDYPAY